jgi:hypothetical protein
MFGTSPPAISVIGHNSMPTKLVLEHSDSNSSTESAASSVGSDGTVSSDSGGGSDGNYNSNVAHGLSLHCKPILAENASLKRTGNSKKVPPFGLSPPSESLLMQRRNRTSLDNKKMKKCLFPESGHHHYEVADSCTNIVAPLSSGTENLHQMLPWKRKVLPANSNNVNHCKNTGPQDLSAKFNICHLPSKC